MLTSLGEYSQTRMKTLLNWLKKMSGSLVMMMTSFPPSVAVLVRPVPVDREQVPRPAVGRVDGGVRGGDGARPPARPDGRRPHQRRQGNLGVLPAPQAEGGQASCTSTLDAKFS